MIRKDFLERLIEQLAAMVRRAFALSEAGDVDGALGLFDEIYRSFGLSRDALARLDAGTVRAMVGDRATALAVVLTAEADVLAKAGRAAEGDERRRFAVALTEP